MNNKQLLQKAAAAIRAEHDVCVEELASLLRKHQPQHYADEKPFKTAQHLSSFFTHLTKSMDEHSLEPLSIFFASTAQKKISRGIQLSDMLEGLMLGKYCISQAILRHTPSSEERNNILAAIDLLYVDLNKITGEKYANLLTAERNAEHERIKLLLEATKAITSFTNPQKTLEHLAQVLSETLDQGFCIIFLQNSETQGLAPHASWGHSSPEYKRCFEGVRLCTSGDSITAIGGESFGICALNSESSVIAEHIPDKIRSEHMALFPIKSSAASLHGIAMIGSNTPHYTIQPEQKELIEGILHTVSAAVELAASIKDKERQLKESESLRRVANLLLQHPEAKTEYVLTVICDEARNIVQSTGSQILLKDGNDLKLCCGSGTPQLPVSIFPIATTKYGEILQKGEAAIITDAQKEIPEAERSIAANTMLIVPLIQCGTAIGLLLISNKETGFDLIDKNIIELFAGQASMALRNATLSEQSDKLVVAEERQRLGRELHDSVTQALYAVTLCADAANRSMSRGMQETAAEQLHALREMAQQAMRDMRSLIFDLHPPELENEGLGGAIQSRMNSVEIRSGLNAKLYVQGEERRLTHSTEDELFRIALEALSNTTKHSRAQDVSVTLTYAPESVTMVITDNGNGFEIDQLPTGGMGLRNIRERAQKIHAKLTINSTKGVGTTITLIVPATR
ncbi:GAF domain-containing sensor histidine kinase [Halodesulfovibrio sp.]|jgi:signal transduction histidine kinase|uniref:GAF domain-containing sensor histidine kinase n=1 Tax=Halodesulfovibrio sp. TaxID=1912772 RepID=UPI0025DD69E2|nr:GAF domain-containing sensor histidine kinase [Halodesulfovibrio sp.]MCT4535101.1 GAF domain-containing sensor histidine kinase [Halodesulfovibrio sp.]